MESLDRHLGRSSDGTQNTPYVTPTEIDPGLLVAVPRDENRRQHKIDDGLFLGFDRWNAYEFSFMLKTGFPVNLMLQILYSSDSPNIVESKSLKLYLNSFNLVKFQMVSIEEGIEQALELVTLHLNACIGDEVFVTHVQEMEPAMLLHNEFELLERQEFVGGFNAGVSNVADDSNGKVSGVERFCTEVLRSNCKVTHQPDWGSLYIAVNGSLPVNPKRLLEYVVSLRQENHFHEEICEMIYNKLYADLVPDDLLVTCTYLRRGGIDINPTRCTSLEFLAQEMSNPSECFIVRDVRQ